MLDIIASSALVIIIFVIGCTVDTIMHRPPPPPPREVPPDFVMPDPTIPWEFWGDADPFLLFSRWLGVQGDWLNIIWEPFWHSLDEKQRAAFLENAPEIWKEWIPYWYEKFLWRRARRKPSWNEFKLIYYQSQTIFSQSLKRRRYIEKICIKFGLKYPVPPAPVPPDFVMPDPTIPWEFWKVVDPDAIPSKSNWRDYHCWYVASPDDMPPLSHWRAYNCWYSWLGMIWDPFWDSLDEGQRADLLEKAPEDWKESILHRHTIRYDYKYHLDAIRLLYYRYQDTFNYFAESEHYHTPDGVSLPDWISQFTFRPPDTA